MRDRGPRRAAGSAGRSRHSRARRVPADMARWYRPGGVPPQDPARPVADPGGGGSPGPPTGATGRGGPSAPPPRASRARRSRARAGRRRGRPPRRRRAGPSARRPRPRGRSDRTPSAFEALDDPVGDRVELPLRAARADDEVVGDGRERRDLEEDDVGRLLVLGELDDPAGEVERRRGRGAGGGVVRAGRPARGAAGCGRRDWRGGRSPSARTRRGRSEPAMAPAGEVAGVAVGGHRPPQASGGGCGRRATVESVLARCTPRPRRARGSGSNGRRRPGPGSRCRDRQPRAVEERPPAVRAREARRRSAPPAPGGAAGAGHDGQPGQREEPLRARARSAGRRAPRPKDEPQVRVPAGGARSAASAAERVDRVARPGPVHLEPARRRTRGCRRSRSSTIASRMRAGRHGPVRLLPRIARPGRRGPAPGRAPRAPPRRREVAEVDRVERPAQDPEAAGDDRRGGGCRPSPLHLPGVRAPLELERRRCGRCRPARTPAPAERGVDPEARRGRAGSARPTPRPRSSSGRRSARSACPGRGSASPSRSIVKPSPAASSRWTTTPAGSGASASVGRIGKELGEQRPERRQALARTPPRWRRHGRPSRRAGRPRTRATPRARPGRSILLKATTSGFSRRAGSWRRSSSRMTPWSHSGSRAAPSTTWTRTRVRSTWRRKAWPRPAPDGRALDEPGDVGDRRPALVLGVAEVHDPEVRLERGERVGGDLRPGRGERGEERRLAGVREADEPDVGDQPELQAQPALLARLALLGVLGRAVGRRSRSGRCRGRRGRRARSSPAGRWRRGRRAARRSRRRARPCRAGRARTRSSPALPCRLRARAAAARARPGSGACSGSRGASSGRGRPAGSIEPPRPPSPPSGPPRGTWASRRNVAAPSPPSPARTQIFTRSRNIAADCRTRQPRVRRGAASRGAAPR